MTAEKIRPGATNSDDCIMTLTSLPARAAGKVCIKSAPGFLKYFLCFWCHYYRRLFDKRTIKFDIIKKSMKIFF
jgi:hypothetical protein